MTGPDDTDDVKLRKLADIATELGATRLHDDALVLAERIADGRFYVACIGQFKRGKSTLLNALVGRAVLPSAILPVTAVPTVLRYGSELNVRVYFTNGESRVIDVEVLESYVSEEKNSENNKGVQTVEVFVPSHLLSGGMCLVDTPGIGSVFESNTATTHAFIPHIDAILVVIGADPPISGDELSLVEQVGRFVQHMVVVLNKADRFTDAECEQAVTFATRVLSQRLHRTVDTVYRVSAAERLSAELNGDNARRDWSELVAALQTLGDVAGQGILRDAAQRGLAHIGQGCRRETDEAIRALRDPVEESDRRLGALKAAIAAVELQLPRLGALIGIERQQITQVLSSRRETFLESALKDASEELHTRMPGSAGLSLTTLRSHAIALARHVAQERLDPWFTSEEAFAEQLYDETATRFAEIANVFLAQVTGQGGEEDPLVGKLSDHTHDAIPHQLELNRGFTGSRFYFHDVEALVRTPSPWPGVVALLRSRAAAVRETEQHAEWYLEQLLTINSTRVTNDIDDRILESSRWLEANVRTLLRDVLSVTERSLARAQVARSVGAARVASEVDRLEQLRREIEECLVPGGALLGPG